MQLEHSNGLVTLNYVVQSVKNELKEFDDKNYIHYLQLAIDGFTELSLFHINSVRVAYLDIDSDTKTVQLPRDYIDYSMIGIIKNGQVYSLTRNDRIPLIREMDCGNDTNNNTTSSANNAYYYVPHYNSNGDFIPKLYAYGGGVNYGYYRIDNERRQIQLQGTLSGEKVVLEYTSTGVVLGEDTYVKRQAVPALKAYVHWMREEFNPTVGEGRKQRLELRYLREVEKLRMMENSFTVDELRDAINIESKQSAKR